MTPLGLNSDSVMPDAERELASPGLLGPVTGQVFWWAAAARWKNNVKSEFA